MIKFSINRIIKYPRILLFLIIVFAVYFFFSGLLYEPLHNTLIYLGYYGTLLAGILYPYSFTSAAGTAMLLILAKHQSLILATIMGSIGALISDVIIFSFVRYSFANELQMLSKEKVVQTFCNMLTCSLRKFIIATFASVLIASPLPTEIGIMLMCSVKFISTKRFAVLVYALHTTAIFVIILIGNKVL